ncbi:hypothetical protein V6N11_053010 [Hibiscus sabdariffa]|uniref:Uncharacterized protein n=1 Tax=Hibiscus sabdariffa TaxID=183260 RepID=A0ABR2UBU4_9ROSI
MRGGQNANELCKDPFAKPPMKAVEEKGSKRFELGLIGRQREPKADLASQSTEPLPSRGIHEISIAHARPRRVAIARTRGSSRVFDEVHRLQPIGMELNSIKAWRPNEKKIITKQTRAIA